MSILQHPVTIGVNLESASEYEKLSAEILRLLRARNLRYSQARKVLSYASVLLEKTIEEELQYLPLADGFEDRFNPDHLILSSKEFSRGTA